MSCSNEKESKKNHLESGVILRDITDVPGSTERHMVFLSKGKSASSVLSIMDGIVSHDELPHDYLEDPSNFEDVGYADLGEIFKGVLKNLDVPNKVCRIVELISRTQVDDSGWPKTCVIHVNDLPKSVTVEEIRERLKSAYFLDMDNDWLINEIRVLN